MKKLVMAAILAGTMCMFGADAAPAAAPEAAKKPARPVAAERQKLTPEERAAFRERMMAARKARMTERLNKVTEALKEAGIADDKAKELADKIEKIYMTGPRGPQGNRRGPRPAPAKEQAK